LKKTMGSRNGELLHIGVHSVLLHSGFRYKLFPLSGKKASLEIYFMKRGEYFWGSLLLKLNFNCFVYRYNWGYIFHWL